MTNNVQRFISIVDAQPKTKPRTSSLIKPWLGIDISQSLSIRMGNILEDFFNELIGDKSLITDLELVGKKRMLTDSQGNQHQIDILGQNNGVVYHYELKSNTDLDRGKKRDTSNRDDVIVQTLQQKYLQPIRSSIFCPFYETSREVGGLGRVVGLAEFIETFELDFSTEEFKALGRNEQIHRALLNI